ncbi:MAG: DUF58 domain-containing protein [Gemmatimonadetes bacterium]|nr:DUF58 domain-containing protein [Gemmatimonadota bacterium]
MGINLVPSGRTLALLGAASLLFLVSAPLALAVDAVVLLLCFLDGRRTAAPSVQRETSRISALAAVTDVVVTATNSSARSVVVRMTDDLDPCLRRVGGPGGTDEWEDGFRLEMPAQSAVRCTYRVTPRTRGFLTLGTIHLRTLSPWGLAWRRSRVDVSHTLQVQPGVRDLLRERSGYAIRRKLRTPGPRRTRQWGEGREFESLRDYVQGDDPRAIDWKASARRRKYVVRNYEAERSQNIVLAIDAGRHMRERLSPVRERIDYALGACMIVASRAQKFGDRVGVVVFDDRIRHVSPPRRADPPALARVFAGVETRLVEPNYPLAFATLGRTFRKRSLVILFCDVIDGSVSRALVNSLTRIGRSHLPLAIAIRNPALEAAATERVAEPDVAYHRAAAEELVQARVTTLQVMRQSGILVVDTPPGDALVRTLDKYVEIKERGLL